MIGSLALFIFAAHAYAQLLSSACIETLEGIASNPDAAACLNPSPLTSVVTGGINTSIIKPIDGWLSTWCSESPCRNATLAAIVQNVTTGCASDLSSTGFTVADVPGIVSAVQTYYPTFRKIACLKDGNVNCLTETLTNLQDALGQPISISYILTRTPHSFKPLLANTVLTCTNCMKAAYNILRTDVPSIASVADPVRSSQCGASFIDGQKPSEIVEAAVEPSVATSKASALWTSVFLSRGFLAGVGMSGILIMTSIFASPS